MQPGPPMVVFPVQAGRGGGGSVVRTAVGLERTRVREGNDHFMLLKLNAL